MPNREERRKFKKRFKELTNRRPDIAFALLNVMALEQKRNLESPKYLPGDKVQLDIKAIKSDPDYKILTPQRHQFIQSNKDTVFTVEYDSNHATDPYLVCLAEDPTDPKWLWWTGHLKKAIEVEEVGSED